ncbi:hypothetical protein Clacol_001783 [Clathrus columnatus]|uniref:Ras-domain-containing protein n=1 Tax=Clathrus columnatus TaxID=1419009 RepID=A0AAV5A3J7_9AGAM|nr:hypothetical protein Clacol_001783 [Clathrus columnatus]
MSYPVPDSYLSPTESPSVDCKVVLMGNTGAEWMGRVFSARVGKTSLLQRYTRNTFDPVTTLSTTGALFVTKKVRLQLWDTAGQERFRSMAPMYYRGAHAALLLYDITNLSSFEDVKGWLEELKKNAATDLIIYIVGSKADLIHHRQVTEDRARLSLHTWFPPPRAPTPPTPETEQQSAFSYIRPHLSSLTSARSVPFTSSFIKPPSSPSPPAATEIPPRGSELKRSKTTAVNGRANGTPFSGSNISSPVLSLSKSDMHFSSNTRVGKCQRMPEDQEWPAKDEDKDDSETSWGLEKGMRLFEVSAKDDRGIKLLFDSLIAAIIAKRNIIREREWNNRDSIILTDPSAPTWDVVANEEAVRQRKAMRSSCCQS